MRLDVVPQPVGVELILRLPRDLQLPAFFLDVGVLETNLIRQSEQVLVLFHESHRSLLQVQALAAERGRRAAMMPSTSPMAAPIAAPISWPLIRRVVA